MNVGVFLDANQFDKKHYTAKVISRIKNYLYFYKLSRVRRFDAIEILLIGK